MSEKNCKVKQGENVKRFSWKTEKLQHSDDEVLLVVDNENKDWKGHILNIVELLNEQQSIIEAKDKEIEESKITIQLYETDVSMRDNFLKSKGLYDEFLQCNMGGG